MVCNQRAQLVLVAAVVIAVALVSIALASLQLGTEERGRTSVTTVVEPV